jgi:deoxyhypusine synthase
MSKYKKLDFKNVKTHSLKDRKSKVALSDFAKLTEKDQNIDAFIDSLPNILTGQSFKDFLDDFTNSIRSKSTVLLMMGAHVIKVGISPLIIDAMKRGWITHLALNGACVIHDVEIALWGITSEDVAEGIKDGSFGMAKESAEFINEAVKNGRGTMGYGEAVAKALDQSNGPHLDNSLLYNAYKLNIPFTVHSALGTEIIHQHPSVDGAAVGDTTWTDFQIFTNNVSTLDKNSTVLNVGSAVIMPEVFLKALTVARNLGFPAFGFSSATFDMIRHYRPTVNVVERPTQKVGKGYYFIGHHEIMLPLLFAALKSRI